MQNNNPDTIEEIVNQIVDQIKSRILKTNKIVVDVLCIFCGIVIGLLTAYMVLSF